VSTNRKKEITVQKRIEHALTVFKTVGAGFGSTCIRNYLLKGTVSPDIAFYFGVYKFKSVQLVSIFIEAA
jgi:hypothetical protein